MKRHSRVGFGQFDALRDLAESEAFHDAQSHDLALSILQHAQSSDDGMFSLGLADDLRRCGFAPGKLVPRERIRA